MNEDEISTFRVFRDCLATPLIEKSADNQKSKKQSRKAKAGRRTFVKSTISTEEPNDVEELAEFVDVCISLQHSEIHTDTSQYIATEIFKGFPFQLRTLTYSAWFNSSSLQALYPDPLPKQATISILAPLDPSITDSLTTYNILPPDTTLTEFLTPILTSFIATITATPTPPSLTKERATACEICDRSWIPLTYHHLIPKQAHSKALKRGWHTEDNLNNVAWICRACHSFVHRVATNEELARDWYTIDMLLEREDVANFATWVGRMRWKGQ